MYLGDTPDTLHTLTQRIRADSIESALLCYIKESNYSTSTL